MEYRDRFMTAMWPSISIITLVGNKKSGLGAPVVFILNAPAGTVHQRWGGADRSPGQ